ncbi:MAG: GntR family transcriptional regulator [Formivibrio sp.]|nr:GntR family transcriptional regulator [Formivibrio sp.]
MKKPSLTSIVPGASAGQQIYKVLRQFIVNCTFAPGESISDKEISEMFGVSRQPVRDAFIKLAEAGLIQVLPQRGTFVRKISSRQVRNARFIREAVETAIVEKAAQCISDADLLALDSILSQQRMAAENNDVGQFLILDDEFHYTLAKSIDCIEAWEMIENIKAQMDRVRFLTLPGISPIEKMADQHQAVVEALHAHDPAQAQAAMHTHLREMIFTFKPASQTHPEWFEDD